MKGYVFLALVCIFDACFAASPCLTESNNADLCSEMLQIGNTLYDEVLEIDSYVQDTIYRSIEEGGRMLASAIEFLKSELTNVKASAAGSAPIEGTSLATLKSQIETISKAAVKTANEEILKEMTNVIRRVETDTTFANAVATNLGFVFTSRKRRSVSTVDELGNSVDGIVLQSLPVLNETLKQADLKMQAAFKKVFSAFTTSIKNLLAGKTQLDFDQIGANMNNMLVEAATLLVESSLSRVKQVVTQSVRQFQRVMELSKSYKSDATKLRNVLEPARARIVEAIQKTRQTSDEAALLERIEAAVDKTQKYYLEIKALVS